MTLDKILLAGLVGLIFSVCVSAQPKVVAHRGYWKIDGSAQNSIKALQEAERIGVFGSECDVLQTKDGVLVVNHDAAIGTDKLRIEDAYYKDLKNIKLSNGETIPTLKQYLKALKKCPTLLLVLEIKEHSTDQKMRRAASDAVAMVKKMKLEDRVMYISFMPTICDQVVKDASGREIAYLSNKMSPEQVKKRGYTGVDFHFSQFQSNPHWVKLCHELGLNVNVWTVNNDDVIKKMIDLGVDFITTDVPERVQELIKESKKAK